MFIKRKFNTDKIYINYTVVQTVRVKLIRKVAVITILYYVEYGDKMLPIHMYIKNPYFGRYFSRSRFQMTAYGPLYTEYQSVDSKAIQFTLSVYVSKYSAQYSGTNGYFRIHVCIILSHDTFGALWVQHN